MFNIRRSIFETNSSSEHAVCVNIGGYITFDKELDEYTEEFYFDDTDIADILSELPTHMLKEELYKRGEDGKK